MKFLKILFISIPQNLLENNYEKRTRLSHITVLEPNLTNGHREISQISGTKIPPT